MADANDAFQKEALAADVARGARDQLLTTLTRRVREALDGHPALLSSADAVSHVALYAARATALAAEELAAIACGARGPEITEVDPRAPLMEAIQGWRALLRTVPMTHGEPTVLLPMMRTDGRWLVRLLSLLIGQVLQRDNGRQAVHADVELGRGFIAHRLQWSGAPLPKMSPRLGMLLELPLPGIARHPTITPLDIALLVTMVQRLGGEVQRDEGGDESAIQGVTVIFPADDALP